MAGTAAAKRSAQTGTPEIDRFWSIVESGESAGHAYVALLGLRTFDTAALLGRIADGLSFSAWERFVKATALPTDVAMKVIQITPRTLSRRKAEGRLHPVESDRLIRIASVFARALVLFEGDAESARTWLLSAQPALHGATPLQYAATEVGTREVEALIGRLEHGIPS